MTMTKELSFRDALRHFTKPSVWLCLLSPFSCVPLLATLWTIARQAPLSMGFSRQEYCSGFPSPFPGALPDSGIKLFSQVRKYMQIYDIWFIVKLSSNSFHKWGNICRSMTFDSLLNYHSQGLLYHNIELTFQVGPNIYKCIYMCVCVFVCIHV